METDTHKAYENFMKTTGFNNTNKVPAVGEKPPMSAGTTAGQFIKHYDKSNPTYAPVVPGQLAATKQPSGKITPNQGLVPGHMPVEDQLNPALIHQTTPLPSSDLLGKTPFVAHEKEKQQDWRAVGVGPETDRKAPGKVASSPPQQGKLKPSFTGKIKKMFDGPDGPFPKQSRVEKMIAGRELETVAFFAAATIVMMILASTRDGMQWGFGVVVLAAITLYSYMKYREANRTENQKGRGPLLKSPEYEADHSTREWDTSEAQVYQPRRTNDPDPNPYPKPMDSMTDTATRLKAQGLDQSNVEGPRGGYWYKRGPTPENRQRVKDEDLMRSAKQFNMNERELEEYMARLDGEAPDQFYQSHAYMPFSPHWDNHQQINDASTVHGISTAPGEFNRKWLYKDPKIQQAGAKTMHTKEPPPGAVPPLEKVHPWMEPNNKTYSEPFDSDQYTEFMTMDNDVKVNKQTAGRLSANRQQEDEYYRNMYGPPDKDPDDLPEALQPVRTSREGMAQQLKERKQKWQQQMANQTQRQMDYMKNVQGYGYTVVPPHPHNPAQVPPTEYANNESYPMKYSAPSRMPNPNLKEKPTTDMVATAPLSSKEKAKAEFASAFDTTTPTDDEVSEALANTSTRR
jgi:hypothetical protein